MRNWISWWRFYDPSFGDKLDGMEGREEDHNINDTNKDFYDEGIFAY